MFRIAVMVEDRKLADVLRSVAGQVHNLEVVPVVIGEAKVDISRAPTLRQMTTTRRKPGGVRRDISPTSLGFKKGQTLDNNSLLPAIAKMGLSSKSGWYCIQRMLKEKTIKRIGTGQYEVIA